MPALAAVLAAAMALSSFLVLRQTPVAPTDHADQLAELRPLVQGQKVLFLGRDNFVAYELRGSRPFTAVRNYYDPNYVKPNLRQRDVFRKFDFDSVTPATLNRFPYVVTTRAAYASGPPPNFKPVRETAGVVIRGVTEEVYRGSYSARLEFTSSNRGGDDTGLDRDTTGDEDHGSASAGHEIAVRFWMRNGRPPTNDSVRLRIAAFRSDISFIQDLPDVILTDQDEWNRYSSNFTLPA